MDKAFSCYKGTSVATESSYPYRGRDGTCSSSYTAAIPKGGVTGYTDVSSSSEALMSALNNNPVSVAVEADQSWNCHFWLRHQPRPRCARRGLRQLCRLLPRQEQLGLVLGQQRLLADRHQRQRLWHPQQPQLPQGQRRTNTTDSTASSNTDTNSDTDSNSHSNTPPRQLPCQNTSRMRGVWRLPLVHDRLLRKQVLRRGHGCGLLPRWPGGHFGLYRRAGQRRQQWLGGPGAREV